MKRFHSYIVIILGCGLFSTGYGQTSNTGILYVSSGTKFSNVEDFENQEEASFYNDGKTYLYSSFRNHGLVDYLFEDGETYFWGNQVQEIQGAGETYFNNVILDNPSSDKAFHLLTTLQIDGHTEFKDGILDTGNESASLLFGAEATHRGVANHSFVDGPASVKGNLGFHFPIGDQGLYRYAKISSGGNGSDVFEAEYFLENSGVKYPHSSKSAFIDVINHKEYWEIVPLSEEQDDRMITLSWDEATTPEGLYASPERLHILRWDEAQHLWVDEGGTADEFNRTVTTAVSDYGIFTLGTVDTGEIMPCDIAVYNAITPNNDGINDYFLIDQSNSNGCATRIGVKIFNRWNVKVFETDDYGSPGNVFNGYSDGRGTVGNEPLPTGTYFYFLDIEYRDQQGRAKSYKKTGYLYLNGN